MYETWTDDHRRMAMKLGYFSDERALSRETADEVRRKVIAAKELADAPRDAPWLKSLSCSRP